MQNGKELSLQEKLNNHSNAVHVIRTNMNCLTPVGLSGSLKKEAQLGYFMMWLFYHQIIIFLSIRHMFDNQQSWNSYVNKKISLVKQIILDFVISSGSSTEEDRIALILPVAEQIYNLQYNWTTDICAILSDAKRNRNNYLRLIPNAFFDLLLSETFEVKDLYREVAFIHELQLHLDDKILISQFEFNKDVPGSEIERVIQQDIYTIFKGEDNNVLSLVVGTVI